MFIEDKTQGGRGSGAQKVVPFPVPRGLDRARASLDYLREREVALLAEVRALSEDAEALNSVDMDTLIGAILRKRMDRLAHLCVSIPEEDAHQRLAVKGAYSEIQHLMGSKEALQRRLDGQIRELGSVQSQIRRLSANIEQSYEGSTLAAPAQQSNQPATG